MSTNRASIENRIFNILTYIEQKTLAFPLKQNIWLFSLKELNILLEFLESWKLKPIYILIDLKYKEYLWLIEELKTLQIKRKSSKRIQDEINEQKLEEKELNNLLNF